MIYYMTTTQNVQNFILDVFHNRISSGDIGFGILDKPFVWVGQKTDLINEEQLKRAQVTTQKTEGAGGTGVMSPGSIAIIKVNQNEQQVRDFVRSVFQLLINKLQERNIACHHEGNDLVLTAGNRKLCGYSFGKLSNGLFFCGLYINIHIDIKLINKICVKKRAPFALSEYGITTEEVNKWLHDFWKKEKWKKLD